MLENEPRCGVVGFANSGVLLDGNGYGSITLV